VVRQPDEALPQQSRDGLERPLIDREEVVVNASNPKHVGYACREGWLCAASLGKHRSFVVEQVVAAFTACLARFAVSKLRHDQHSRP
jgi:hypothetical protein